MRSIVLLSLAICLLSCLGCSPSVPALQNLSPVEIQVVRDGNPVEGIQVVLYSEEPQGAVGCNALTDRRGVAVLKTSVQTKAAKGVKPGAYKVVFTKNVAWPPELSDFEADTMLSESDRNVIRKKRDDFLNENRIIPKALEMPETTPVKLEVKPKEKNSLVVDLAKY